MVRLNERKEDVMMWRRRWSSIGDGGAKRNKWVFVFSWQKRGLEEEGKHD